MTQYEKNFKQMITELNQTWYSVRESAKEYGVSEEIIYKLEIAKEISNNDLRKRISTIFLTKQRYGATKIHQVLLKEKLSVSLKHIQKLMTQLNLRSIVFKNTDLKSLFKRFFQKRTF
ncbi:IS3 family transposase [Enterococcus rivorum]|uniref:HTH-like domain-containing protein n=1 Tax=Enterococcus rivorum TaxID=762845 RepID=A0A1E5L0Q9_9ENTE|nr:IS3 family transposase [Enterococcus rivorum]MBP2098450.1 Zn-dependent peptidase ImmA (M78 family) [Enterococcus rivorum]OEH83697.1 hypothetical protein BCR26_08500 [Enterococcus rivorum]